MGIQVITGFDGSSPHSADKIFRDAQGRFVFHPERGEDEGFGDDSGPSPRIYLRVVNSGPKPVETILIEDREGPYKAENMENLDYGYVSPEGEKEWTMVPWVRTSEGTHECRHIFGPGTTEFARYPEYNCEKIAAFAKELAAAGITVEKIGQSEEGRPIHLFSFPSPGKGAKNFLIQARDHAYESAGSYCVEGIARFLISGDPLAVYLRSKFNVHIIPMTNPDGVYNGFSRFTRKNGADMNRIITVSDKAHAVLGQTVDSIAPVVHTNIHNWTYKFEDGLLCSTDQEARELVALLPADHAHFKHWRVETTADYKRKIGKDVVPPENKSWKSYCHETFEAFSVTFEFPWFGLNTADMMQKGKKAFISQALAAISVKGL